ncbi:class I SAM-dependent methyltransferase [Streptomyces sp. Amel2xC10]|uniref:class I SAM-dependent methyltransferase n=1 Tax=Streptomyces sp. Amel2xC10 TaxID=1305826 RepID=UPI000A083F33|nr:class I SAM-dependent methyltransferase [Streptomyces sp. Amel2xC10]SMF79003.1 methyltransferase, TIGR00027 family [Streptomyces sp. Amel2xC10]
MGVTPARAEGPSGGHVPATAFLTAVARARATADGALRDPFAARFAELCPPAVRGITRNTAGTAVLVARTVLVDRMLADLFGRERVETFVNLGAGFDARPFRMEWPGHCPVVEVDSAPVLGLKDRLLPGTDAACPIERVPCDLHDTDRLTGLLLPHTAERRCVVLAEGLLTYLPRPAVRSLASALALPGTSTTWICDVLSSGAARSLGHASRTAGAPLEMHGHADLSLFEEAGWHCEEVEPLPSARLAPGTAASSRLLPDSVLRLRHRGADAD